MDLPKGTKVRSGIFPDIYTIDGPAAKNDIGYLLVPVITSKGARAFLHPKSLIVVNDHEKNKSPFSLTQNRAVGS